MTIHKVISGFVVQKFDTETRRFTEQYFIGGDDSEWTNNADEPLDMNNNADLALIYGEGGVDEPHLNMEMVQPNYTVKQPPTSDLPRIDPLLAQATSFEVGEQVTVIPSDNPDDLVRNEFMGIVVGLKDGNLVTVKDQEDNVFDVDPIQCYHVM